MITAYNSIFQNMYSACQLSIRPERRNRVVRGTGTGKTEAHFFPTPCPSPRIVRRFFGSNCDVYSRNFTAPKDGRLFLQGLSVFYRFLFWYLGFNAAGQHYPVVAPQSPRSPVQGRRARV